LYQASSKAILFSGCNNSQERLAQEFINKLESAIELTEKQTEKLYSAKNIQRYKFYPFEFPWEKKVFDKNDTNCKVGTYWFDPVEFDKNIYYYSLYVIPIVNEIKSKIKTNQLRVIS